MKRASIACARLGVAAVVLLLLLVAAVEVWRSKEAIRSAANEVRSETEFAFTVGPFAARSTDFEPISSPAVFFHATELQDHLYVAGPPGLLEYSPDGALTRQFAAGRDLPGSPLVAMAAAVLADSHVPELIIATAGAGILAYDGRSFRRILPSSSEDLAVNAILPTASGHLLIGTSKRGVLVYDGKRIAVFHPTLDNVHVTALAGSDSDLWVGTLSHGALHFHAGETETFTEAQGLPDPQVLSLFVDGEQTYVGTATGVAVFHEGRFARVLAPGVLATALLVHDNQLYVGSEDEGVFTIPLSGRRPNSIAPQSAQFTEVRQLFVSAGNVFAVARNGVYRMGAHSFGWQRVLEPESAVLSDRNISALAADTNGNVWIGYFDRGLDLLAADSRVRHVEDEHVFCVNRILPNAKSGIVNVATANGLVRFSASGGEEQVLTRSDGLIADHVTDVANYRDGLALATPAGLTFLDASGARSMYAFHGLVNNHVYALAVAGDELVAGTLGGISLLNKGDVAANFTTSNSNLKHNWITAVVRTDSDWLVGTYGAGILRLDASGKFHTMETGSGDFEVNPNAMLVTPNLVLAGTLGQGLYVLDRRSDRWSIVRDGLPSLNVTAMAEAGGYLYIGTDNGLVRIPEQKLLP